VTATRFSGPAYNAQRAFEREHALDLVEVAVCSPCIARGGRRLNGDPVAAIFAKRGTRPDAAVRA